MGAISLHVSAFWSPVAMVVLKAQEEKKKKKENKSTGSIVPDMHYSENCQVLL